MMRTWAQLVKVILGAGLMPQDSMNSLSCVSCWRLESHHVTVNLRVYLLYIHGASISIRIACDLSPIAITLAIPTRNWLDHGVERKLAIYPPPGLLKDE